MFQRKFYVLFICLQLHVVLSLFVAQRSLCAVSVGSTPFNFSCVGTCDRQNGCGCFGARPSSCVIKHRCVARVLLIFFLHFCIVCMCVCGMFLPVFLHFSFFPQGIKPDALQCVVPRFGPGISSPCLFCNNSCLLVSIVSPNRRFVRAQNSVFFFHHTEYNTSFFNSMTEMVKNEGLQFIQLRHAVSG